MEVMFPSSRNGRLDCTVVYCDTDCVVAIATFQVNTRLVVGEKYIFVLVKTLVHFSKCTILLRQLKIFIQY